MINYSDLCGVININKDKGCSSHDVVYSVRKALGKVKTGHTGTLDPIARGVLPICIGRATKLMQYIAAEEKEYEAEVTLGITTDTLDTDGKIIEKNTVAADNEQIMQAVESFKGDIFQIPPMYSAVHVNGKRLYELARQGIEIEREKRAVSIYAIEVTGFKNENVFTMKVVCSKGTYIRTLCADIGEKLGCGACMSELTRLRTGRFSIENSVSLEELRQYAQKGEAEKLLIHPEEIFDKLLRCTVSENFNKYLYNGNSISLSALDKAPPDNERALLYDANGKLAGLYLQKNGFMKPLVMLLT